MSMYLKTAVSRIKRVTIHREEIHTFNSLYEEFPSLIHKELLLIVREQPNNLIQTKAK